MAIDPNLAVAIDAIEIDQDELALSRQWNTECLAVPANAAGQCAASSARRILLVEFAFNAPIMRQIQFPPVGIIEIWILSVGNIAQMESPRLIETHCLSRSRIGIGSKVRKGE